MPSTGTPDIDRKHTGACTDCARVTGSGWLPRLWRELSRPQPPRLDFALLLLACLAVFFFKLGATGIIDPGDGYYTEGAREMVESGDYVIPQLNCQTYFSKPILIFWLISAAYHMFGLTEFAARFFSAVSATILVLCTYYVVRSLNGRRAGMLSGLILASSPLVVMYARMSMIDMTFATVLGVALCALVMTVACGGKRWWPVFYGGLGLSIITKGPVGVVYFCLTGLVYLALTRPKKADMLALITDLHPVAGIIIMLAVAAPWYIAVGLATNWLWTKVFFLLENFGRFSGETNYHPPTLWFYLPVLFYGLAPWVVFLPPALTTALSVKESDTNRMDKRRRGMLVFACFAVAVFVFMSLSKTQLSYYILPVVGATAALIGITCDRWITEHSTGGHISSWLKNVASPVLAVLGLACAAGGVAAACCPCGISSNLRPIAVAGLFAFAVGLLAQYAMLKAHRVQLSLVTLAISCAIATTLLAPVAFDFSFRKMNLDLQTIATRLYGTSTQVVVYKSFNPSLMFYLRRPIDFLFEPKLLEKAGAGSVKRPHHLFVITRDKDSQELLSLYPDNMRQVDARGYWRVFETTGLSAYKQQPLWMLYQYCFETLVRGKDKYGPMVVPYSAGLPRVRH